MGFGMNVAVLPYANATLWMMYFCSWTQSARYPSFTEQYAAGWFLAAITPTVSIPLASFQPQYSLKPEFATETDLGIEFHPAPWWTAKLDAYQKSLRDFIVLTYPGGTFRNVGFQNHPNGAMVRGVEAELRAARSMASTTGGKA